MVKNQFRNKMDDKTRKELEQIKIANIKEQ